MRIIQVRNSGFEDGVFHPWRDVGNVTVTSDFPRTGQYSAFFLVQPYRSASLTQLVHLGPPEPYGLYHLSFWVSRGTFATTGTLVVSFSRSLQPPLIIPFENIPLVTRGYKPFAISVPANAFTHGYTEIRFEVNGGANTVSLELDDVKLYAT